MNVDRAMISRAIQTGTITTLITRGIGSHHFNTNTPDGKELADVFEWLTDYAKKYGAPSIQIFRERWPGFQFEPCSDPIEPLIDAFLQNVKRRAFSAKVIELAHAEQDPNRWGELDQIMLDAARDLAALVPSGRVHRFSDMPKRVGQYDEEVANPELRKGWSTGISIFDDVTNGMQPGNLVTVAGYSGRGKSLLSAYLTMSAYEQEAMGLIMSLEMTAPEIFERLDTMVVNFSHKLLAQRRLPENDLALWRRISKQFAGAKNDIIVKDDLLGCTTDRVYAEITRYKPDVVVVDYVQLMRSRQSYASQWQGLVDITNDLKQIAIANDCVIIMVSQDGRSSADEGSGETNMGGSISVYQAADIYLGLHQTDEMYADHVMEVRLLKNRRGVRQINANMIWKPETMELRYQDKPRQQSERFLKTAA